MPLDSRALLFGPAPPPADARLAYGPEPLQFGDLRLPRGEGPHPLAIVVHGGYWRGIHNLIHTGHICVALRDAGIATWNVEYRRVGDVGGGWPESADDVELGVRFVDELCGRFPLDRDRVLLVGHSAGGHLALVAAKRTGLPVVALAPVTDLRESIAGNHGNGAARAFLGGDDSRADEASPVRMLPLGVPHVVVHGTEDDSVPYSMSERYAAAAGDEAAFVTLPGAMHFEMVDPRSREWELVRDIVAQRLTGDMSG